MTGAVGKNTAASIRDRLLSLTQSKGEDYQRILGSYAIERFLYRLGQSPYVDRFALKGAALFTLWTGQTHRPTKDLDLLGQGSSAEELRPDLFGNKAEKDDWFQSWLEDIRDERQTDQGTAR